MLFFECNMSQGSTNIGDVVNRANVLCSRNGQTCLPDHMYDQNPQ